MLRSSNLASIFPNSKYIERYTELKLEMHDLSCFDLTSKELDLVAYIGRTSAITKFSLDLEYGGRIKEMKFCEIHLL